MLLTASVVVSGCERAPYSTTSHPTELAAINEKKISIIAFSADPDIAILGGSVLTGLLRVAGENKEWEAKLATSHLSSVVGALRKNYLLVGPTDYLLAILFQRMTAPGFQI